MIIYINILYNCCISRRIKTRLNIQRKNKLLNDDNYNLTL